MTRASPRRSHFPQSLFALLSAVMISSGVYAAEPTPPKPVDPFITVSAQVRPSVVAVGSYHSKDTPTVVYSGTGFVVGDGRTVATNAHVVDSIRQRGRTDQMKVFFPDGGPVDGRTAVLIAEDRLHDVALLRFDGAPAATLSLDTTQPGRQGQSVGVMGYPIGLRLGLVPAVHKGVIAAVVPAVLPLPTGTKLTPELADALNRPYNLYQLDLVVFPGNSGSPMFDADSGQVIGVINKTLASKTREHLLESPSGISYAVPARWVVELIENARAGAPGGVK